MPLTESTQVLGKIPMHRILNAIA